MTAAALQFVQPELAGEKCAGCDSPMLITRDAVGRPRKRCPQCDGISRKRAPHPDEVLIPQGLVRAQGALPEIRAGQLRCQRCARGVEGRARFCVDCNRWTRGRPGEKPCPDCGVPFLPSRSHHARCADCANKERPKLFRVCLSCNRMTPRAGGRATTKACAVCRPKGNTANRLYRLKPCLECGTTFQPSGPRASYCEACR